MNREEAIQFIKDGMCVGENKVNEFYKAVERLEQPPTLAEFLGWEDEVEYELGNCFYKVKGDCLYYKTRKIDAWIISNESLSRYSLLREATKVEEPKYYAKVKGCENAKLPVYNAYWNHIYDDEKLVVNSKTENRIYKTKYTKSVWNELGINDKNADFEEVEE